MALTILYYKNWWLRLKDKRLNESEDAYITFGKRCSTLVNLFNVNLKVGITLEGSESFMQAKPGSINPADHSI